MAGPRTKRKRPEGVTLRRQKRDTTSRRGANEDGDNDQAEAPPQPPQEQQQNETTATTATNTEVTDAPDKNDASSENQRQRLTHRLNHYQLLRQRIVQARNVAKKRLGTAASDDNDELAAFQQSCRQAASVARKQSDHPPPRSSLRKGSSVGKRMNAALSSLAGGTAASHNNSTQQTTTTTPAASTTTTSAPRPTSQSNRASQPAISRTALQPPQHPVLPPTAALMETPTSSRPIPQVHCPPAIALRNRRNALRNQLVHLTKSRKTNWKTSLTLFERQMAHAGPPQATPLPARRQTHWDVVLQEMKWLATDFRQERSWKTSMGRVLSNALLRPAKIEEVKPPVVKPKEDESDAMSAATTEEETTPTKEPTETVETSPFPSVTEQDIAQAQSIAQRLSLMIQQVVRTSTEPPRKIAPHEPTEAVAPVSVAEQSQHVDDLLQQVQTIPAYKHKAANVKLRGHDMELTLAQAKVTGELEGRWNCQAGAILQGSLATGKTMVACAVLWKRRQSGPQLVVCASERVIRWLHELYRFDDVNRKTVGYNVGNNSSAEEKKEEESYESGDVVVCEYGALETLSRSTMAKFETVVLDERFPDGFLGSRAPALGEDGSRDAFSAASEVPHELRSPSFWAHLAGRDASTRLLIQGANPFGFQRHLCGLSERHILEVLALRMVFMLGGSKFQSSEFSLQKSVLAWGRKRIKTMENGGSKFVRLQQLLESLVSPLVCTLDKSLRVENFTTESNGDACWELRRAEMPKAQRSSYEKACAEYSAVLMSDAADSARDSQVASALFDIRMKCTHANIGRALQRALSELGNRSNPVITRPNLGQPNLFVASQLISGSGKLKCLLEILASDTAVVSETLSEVQRQVGGADPGDKSEHAASADRVMIVATLPEVQLLVSLLLQSLGIDHDVLVRKATARDERNPLCSSTLSWSEAQLILSEFNDPDIEDETKIVICSPLTAAGDHGGLGGELADVVISLDEDWSGRGELIQKALVSRNTYYEKAFKDEACVFLKIVSSDTCEEVFLEGDGDSDEVEPVDNWPLPLDRLGEFTTRQTRRRNPANKNCTTRRARPGLFSFPSRNIFVRRNFDLAGVFVASGFKSLYQPTSSPFLPCSDDSTERSADELRLCLALMATECKATNALYGQSIVPPLPVDQVSMLVSRQDLQSLSSRALFPRDALVLADDDGADQSSATMPQSDTGEMSAAELDGGASLEVAGKEEAVSLLFYGSGTIKKTATRANIYASCFSSLKGSLNACERNHTAESAMYFPPIFPRMRECSIQASFAVESARASRRLNETEAAAGEKRAADDGAGDVQDSKLPRLDGIKDRPYVTEDEASHSDAASVLLDLSDDYGLAGIGAIPLPRDSAIYASSALGNSGFASVGLGQASVWDAMHAPYDFAESEALYDSKQSPDVNAVVLLMSKKRQRGYGDAHHLLAHTSTNGKYGSQTHNFAMSPSAFSAVQHDGAGLALSGSKDSQRSRLLSSTRQSGTGSMFEAPSFRAASVRLRNRIADRLVRHCWQSSSAFESGPGLPLHISKQHATPSAPAYRSLFSVDPSLWTSVVKRLKNRDASTGDEAIEHAIAQRNAFRRSLNSPCRVDFGPFQCGFLAATSGMTSVAPPRPRSGVSLPMGVKTLQPSRDQDLPWSQTDDDILKKCVARFGTNWTLAARCLSDFQDIAIFSKQAAESRRTPRAARSCRDRWQALTRMSPSLAQETRQSERSLRENSAMGYSKIIVHEDQPMDTEDSEMFLIPAEWENQGSEEDSSGSGVDHSKGDTAEKKNRRSFSALNASKAKKQTVPITIHGFPPGAAPTIVPSHPSHIQSLQSSVATMWSGARKDMWPLQLLDAADRQRAPQGRSHVSSNTPSAGRSTSASTVQTSHRSAGGSQQRPPPNVGYPTSQSARPAPSRQTAPQSSAQNFAPPVEKNGQDRRQ